MRSRRVLGAAALGLCLAALLPASAGAVTFSNPTPISIPVGGNTAGSPYPSTIAVSGITTQVVAVRATLAGINEGNPSHLDALLVGPGGQNIVLISDACGTADLTGETFTFADGATPLPMNCPGLSGTHGPTDEAPAETLFNNPAPAGPYGSGLLALGASPNGTWRLFVRDGGPEVQMTPAGSIAGGWLLDLDVAPPANPASPALTNPCPVAKKKKKKKKKRGGAKAAKKKKKNKKKKKRCPPKKKKKKKKKKRR